MEPKKETNGDADEEALPLDNASSVQVSEHELDHEHDELEETPAPSENGQDEAPTSPLSEPIVKSRRQANLQQAANKAEEEAKIKAEREIVKAKKEETKALTNEKR